MCHEPVPLPSIAATPDATRQRALMLTPAETFAVTIRHFGDETGTFPAHPGQPWRTFADTVRSTAGYRAQARFHQECVQRDGERGEFAHDLVRAGAGIRVVLAL